MSGWLHVSSDSLAAIAAAAETFKDVPVVDSNCSKKVADAPDNHTRKCALKCEASGYGIITDDKILKLDAAGNKEITAWLLSRRAV